MVKNEMDIIESFVRHTLGFADLLIVADHKSTDRTREILESLQAEGLPLIIMEQPCRWLAVLHDDYTRPVKEPSIEDIAAHQMEWHALCIEDATLLQENEQAAVLDRQRRIGIYLLEHAIASGIDLQSGIWPAYQQMLASL